MSQTLLSPMLSPVPVSVAPAPAAPSRYFSIRRLLAVALLAAGLAFAAVHFGVNRRLPVKWLLLAAAGLMVGGQMLSERRRRRRDLQPDILAALFPAEELLQFDQVHLKVFSAQYAGRFRVVLIAQNVRDVAGPLKVQLLPTVGRRQLAARLPTLSFEIPPAAVVLARLDVPLRAVQSPRLLRLAIKGGAPLRGGHAVRFARRRPVRQRPHFPRRLPAMPPSPWQWLQRGTRSFQALLQPFALSAVLDPLAHPPAWTLCTLWIPADPVPLPTITRTLAQVRGGSTSRFLG